MLAHQRLFSTLKEREWERKRKVRKMLKREKEKKERRRRRSSLEHARVVVELQARGQNLRHVIVLHPFMRHTKEDEIFGQKRIILRVIHTMKVIVVCNQRKKKEEKRRGKEERKGEERKRKKGETYSHTRPLIMISHLFVTSLRTFFSLSV
jgi:hypothetical protein